MYVNNKNLKIAVKGITDLLDNYEHSDNEIDDSLRSARDHIAAADNDIDDVECDVRVLEERVAELEDELADAYKRISELEAAQ